MNTDILWWGYKHINNSYQAKRYFGPDDILEAKQSPFCAKVTQPFLAKNRDDALKMIEKLTS